MSDAALILRKINGVRRRIFLVHAVNSLSIAACGAAFLFTLLNFRSGPWLYGTVPALVCTAAAAAFFRTPGRQATARIFDRRFSLQQRIETALECIPPRTDVDRLVLKDAAQRIAHAVPSAIMPVRFAQFARVTFSAGLITLAALALIRFLESWNQGDAPAQRGRPPLMAQAPSQAAEIPAARIRNEVLPASGARTQGFPVVPTERGAARSLSGPEKDELSDGSGAAARPGAQSSGTSGAPGPGESGQPPGIRYAQPEGRTGLPGARSTNPLHPVAGGRSAQAQAGSPLSGKAGEQASPNRPGLPAVHADAAAKPGPLAGGTDARTTGRGAGQAAGTGTAAGQPVPAPVSKPDAALMARYARESAAYRRAVEGVLARESIPPGLRKYIADYFASIQR